ncbi:MAG: HAMP domain-containing histidine kinase, partial [Proteobacteria bacterium]
YNDAWAPIPADKHPWALGRPAHEVWADIWPTVGPQFTQVIETGQGFAAYDQFLPMERGGQPRETWWTYAFTPLTDEQDRTLGILNQGHETTLKVLQDRARVDEVQRMRELFAQAPGAVALLAGPTHVFTMVNDAYSALAGNVRLLGLTVAEAMPEVVRQGFVDLLDGVFRTGLPYRGISTPVFLRGAKGELVEHSLDFVYQPILDAAGRTTDILVQISDQTGRDHALRQLRDADRRKDVFIATLAHELRNPLAPIRNGLQILKQANFSDARFERTRQMMERQLGHLVHLVDDLLDVSRITSGKVQLQYRRVPLADAVARAVESTHAAFEQKAQRLGVDVGDEALAVDGDPERLTQVFANLLSNAAKFTGEGGNVELSLFQ